MEGNKSLKHKPVVLAFTKADLFGAVLHAEESAVAGLIMKLGFGERIPERTVVPQAELNQGSLLALAAFRTLVRYLESESLRYRTAFVSCFSYDAEHERLGVGSVLRGVLPR